MFYELKENQKVFVELTNPIHGGPGWEFGTCLWSPSKSKASKSKDGKSKEGKDAWAIMKRVEPGDLIIHSLKNKSKGHSLAGYSIAASKCNTIEFEPPFPDRWGGMESYYRIELKEYIPFNIEIALKDFLETNKGNLTVNNGSFYTSDFQTAQKYLAEVPREVFSVLCNYFENKSIRTNISIGTSEAGNESEGNQHSGNMNPQRTTVQTTRIIRDTKIIKELKKQTNNVCQICGKQILLSNGKFYSEGHHLKPLGNAHNGPDVKENVVILCPNHHTEFDYGSIAIDPSTMKVLHIDSSNEFHNKPLAYTRNEVSKEYLNYHFKNLFNKK